MDTCKKEYTYADHCIMNLGDLYTLLYGYICKHLIDECGEAGERAARRGTRHYGWDRGFCIRRKCLAAGAKINMQSLFGLFPDLPGDPRFRREKQRLNPCERVSHTLVCPMAEIWIEKGLRREGRMYCEEFHPADYGHFAFNRSQVNLSKTLTQEGDDYCAFNVKLIPYDLPLELRPVCFEEFDPLYKKPVIQADPPKASGFYTLSAKVYYHLLDCAMLDLGEAGAVAIEHGLTEFAQVAAELLRSRCAAQGEALTLNYVQDNLPVWLDTAEEKLWTEKVSLAEDPTILPEDNILPDALYGGHEAAERMERAMVQPLLHALGLEK